MSLNANRNFIDLVKSIGESRSKQEEDRIVSEEVYNFQCNLDFMHLFYLFYEYS